MRLTSLLRTGAAAAVLSVVFLISSPKAQAQSESTLYSFCSVGGIDFCFDGVFPIGPLTPDRYGNLYGVTDFGGTEACDTEGDSCVGGTVFQLSPEPSAGCPGGFTPGNGWCETVLYNFCAPNAPPGIWPDCADGDYPQGSLTLVPPAGHFSTAVGTLYGTTNNGGIANDCGYETGCGTVFELSPVPLPQGTCPSGSTLGNGWCEKVIYAFCSQSSCADGGFPVANLVRDSAGNLYGVNSAGVFELSPSGSSWIEQVIYADIDIAGLSFLFGNSGLAMDASGNLFGFDVNPSTYVGNVFKLTPDHVATYIHTFSGSPDGFFPLGTPVVDSAGNVYGTTIAGGSKNMGTVWKLIPVTTGTLAGTYKEKIAHSFDAAATGDSPQAGITLDSAGNIYGTTAQGGKYITNCKNSTNTAIGCGTVFKMPLNGELYGFKLLWSFNSADGSTPGGLILNGSGNLLGATAGGGSVGGGTAFEINPSAPGTTTMLTASPNPAISGEGVTFTATVSSSAGAPPDGETVNFMKGTTVLGTGTLSGGEATFTTSSLPVGSSLVHAVYGGDLNFEQSTSAVLKEVVEK